MKNIHINDSIHGLIQLTDYEKKIIGSVPFNRLHDIYQNSMMYMTFPSNRTKRFEHSIGAMYLAHKMYFHSVCNTDEFTLHMYYSFLEETIETIIKNEICNKYEALKLFINRPKVKPFSDYDFNTEDKILIPNNVPDKFKKVHLLIIRSIRLAALLHDIGHPPYSHIIENALMKIHSEVKAINEGERNEKENTFLTNIKNLNNYGLNLGNKISFALHENMGVYLSEALIKETNKAIIEGNEFFYKSHPDRELELYLYFVLVHKIFNNVDIFGDLHSLIDGTIDCDRLDYVTRDAKNSGMLNGQIDYKRIYLNMKIIFQKRVITPFLWHRKEDKKDKKENKKGDESSAGDNNSFIVPNDCVKFGAGYETEGLFIKAKTKNADGTYYTNYFHLFFDHKKEEIFRIEKTDPISNNEIASDFSLELTKFGLELTEKEKKDIINIANRVGDCVETRKLSNGDSFAVTISMDCTAFDVKPQNDEERFQKAYECFNEDTEPEFTFSFGKDIQFDDQQSVFCLGKTEYQFYRQNSEITRNVLFAYPIKSINSIDDVLKRRFEIYNDLVFHHRSTKIDMLLRDSVERIIRDYFKTGAEKSSGNSRLPDNISGLWDPFKPDAPSGLSNSISQWTDAWLITMLRQVFFDEKINDVDFYYGSDLRDEKRLEEYIENHRLACELSELIKNEQQFHTLIKRASDFKIFDDSLRREVKRLLKDDFGEEELEKFSKSDDKKHRFFYKMYASKYEDNGFFSRMLSDPVYYDAFRISLEKCLKNCFYKTFYSATDIPVPESEESYEQYKKIHIIAEKVDIREGIPSEIYFYDALGNIIEMNQISSIKKILLTELSYIPLFYVYVHCEKIAQIKNGDNGKNQFEDLKHKFLMTLGREVAEDIMHKII